MPGVEAIGGAGGSSTCSTSAKACRKWGERFPLPADRLRPAKLVVAQGGRHVGQVVLVAGGRDAIVPEAVAA